jgi:zinc finger SWIM domain-containing protein 3
MLNQVAKVYTPKVIELLQNEVEEVPLLSIIDHDESQKTHRYVVVFNGHGKYNIMWNPSNQTLSCSCRKFETFGILYWYAIKILDVWDIKLIPNGYILKRWRRDAKDENEQQFLKNDNELDTRLGYEDRYQALCPKYIQLVNEACEIKKGFNVLNAAIANLKKRLCDANNCQANAEEDNISLSTNIVDKGSTMCFNYDGRAKRNKEK